MRITKRARFILEYSGIRLFCSAACALPPRLTIAVGKRIAQIAAGTLKSRVRLAHQNLEHAFGTQYTAEQRQKIIEELFSLLGEAVIESIIFNQRDMNNLTIDGMEHVEAALAEGHGVIMLVPHYGIWELASFIFGNNFSGTSVIYKSMKNPYLDRYLMRTRRESNLTLIPSKNALRLVIKTLKQSRIVGILYDQNAGKQGIPATFCGKTAFTYAAPAVFSQKTGCAVIPAYMQREPGFRKHRLIIGKPFPQIETGDKEKDLLANTQQYNDFLEDLVRKHPEQWFGWLHNRWKIPRKFKKDFPE